TPTRSSTGWPWRARSASPASACGRQLAAGTTFRAAAIAHAIRSAETGPAACGRARPASRRRTVLSGNTHNARRALASQSTDRIRSERSDGSSPRHRSSSIRRADLDETLGGELVEQGNKVRLAALRFHIVLIQDNVADLQDPDRLLDQLPDSGSHLPQPVV